MIHFLNIKTGTPISKQVQKHTLKVKGHLCQFQRFEIIFCYLENHIYFIIIDNWELIDNLSIHPMI